MNVWDHVADRFTKHVNDIRTFISPDFDAELQIGEYEEFPNRRDWAYCVQDEDGIAVVVSPDFWKQSADRKEALIRHELAHALEFHVGLNRLNRMFPNLPRGSERRADTVAFRIWGDRVVYDDDDVQSLRHGVSPRPDHLGA